MTAEGVGDLPSPLTPLPQAGEGNRGELPPLPLGEGLGVRGLLTLYWIRKPIAPREVGRVGTRIRHLHP